MNGRHEYKHSLNFMDYQILKSRLSAVLARDKYTDQSGAYIVRSLYFDTPSDRALLEKINGVDRREKFRLRCYNTDFNFFRLEKKSKITGLSYKQTVPISREEVAALIDGDFQWMNYDQRPLVGELYSKISGQLLRPKTIVEYVREPFVFAAGNVRITLDRNIRTGLISTDFLNDQLVTIPADDHLIVLEVKYDAFIPDFIVKLLQINNRQATACSKYALCRVYG